MQGLIFDFVFKFIVFIVLVFLYLRKVVKKEILLKTVEGIEDIVLKSIVGLVWIILLFTGIFPMIRDIPYMIQNDYCTIEGIAQANSSSTNLATLGITLKDKKTKQDMYVEFGYRGKIEKGDQLTVQYLPHSKYGFLIELNGKSYHKAVE